jgi:cytochrome P450
MRVESRGRREPAITQGDARHRAMTSFVPPYPDRPARPLSVFSGMRMARQNFLSIWPEECFRFDMFTMPVLARTVYVCNSPDTVVKALIENHEAFERKSPQMRHALEPLLGDGLFISDGATWRARRRLVSPIVHASNLPIFAPIMAEAASELAKRWHELASPQPIDVLAAMANLTAEIICRTVFGRRLGMAYTSEIVAAFSEYQRRINQLDLVYLFGLPDWLPRYQPRATRRAAQRIHGVLDRVIRSAREQARNGDASMITLLLDAKDPETGDPLDDLALRNEAATIFMAGHETTANSLAWTWYLLSQSPEVEARLHAELDEVLGGRVPTFADLPRLVYTRAVFDEAVRLYPPVPLLARQATRAERIRRWTIEAGSLLIVVPWLLQRHRKYWDQPDAFVPERFLPDAGGRHDRRAYLPFSIGPRVCAGAAFGLSEAILCIATLAQKARLRLAPGAVVKPVCRLTLRPGDALPMILTPR